MSTCPNCGNHGTRNGEYCDCVYGIQARLRNADTHITLRSRLPLTATYNPHIPMPVRDSNRNVIGYCTVDEDGTITAHVPVEYAELFRQRSVSMSIDGSDIE